MPTFSACNRRSFSRTARLRGSHHQGEFMALCPYCGSQVPAGAQICPFCGLGLDVSSASPESGKDPSTGPLYAVHTRLWFRQGWETFKRYPLGFFWFGALCLLVSAGLGYLSQRLLSERFFVTALMAPLYTGILVVCVKLRQRQFVQFPDFFLGLHFYKPLIAFAFLTVLVGKIGYLLPEDFLLRLLCNLVFLAFVLLNLFTPWLIIDRRLGWQEAMALSWRTVQRRPLPLIGFMLWGLLVAACGLLALIIGSLVTIPVFLGALTAAYDDLFGLQSQEYKSVF